MSPINQRGSAEQGVGEVSGVEGGEVADNVAEGAHRAACVGEPACAVLK